MQKNAVLGVIAAVALLIAAYLVFSGYGRVKEVPTNYEVDGVCLACESAATVATNFDEDEPYKCPSCGEQAVYPWLFCFDCEKRYVPRLEPNAGGLPKMPGFPRCPECRGARWAAFDPEDPGQKSKGDIRLPKWNP